MSEKENEEVFRRLIEEGFNKGNLAVLDDLFTPNFTEHQDGFVPPNLEGVKGAIVSLRTPFPELRLTIEEIIASGDKTWARITARGKHQGPFMGQPPTGKPFAITVIDICRFENGLIVEHWGVADRLGLMGQLGLFPRPPQGTA
ncbi:MAG: ester cyclase [Chloroflexota bacterium]